MMRSLQNFIIILTIATLASDGIASPVPENVKGNFEKKIEKNICFQNKGTPNRICRCVRKKYLI